MSGTTISTTVTYGVTLGSPNFEGPLSLTATGIILPSAYGVTGLQVPSGAANPTIISHGVIKGGFGSDASNFNNMDITPAGIGGIGVDIDAAGASLNNYGLIKGGDGGGYLGGSYQEYTAANGGVGVRLAARSGVVTNSGQIIGGSGGGLRFGHAGAGAVAVELVTGTLINSGSVTGGNGGTGSLDSYSGAGGAGVIAQSGALIINTKKIAGGEPGGDGALATGGEGVDLEGATLVNYGTVTGGMGNKENGSGGGVGVQLNGGELTNAGTIEGGTGGNYYGSFRSSDAEGGIGAYVISGSFSNTGSVLGGTGGSGGPTPGGGGAGIKLSTGTLINFGTVTGGRAGFSSYSVRASAGGDGITAISNAVIINSGTISAGYSLAFIGGAGSTGAYGLLLGGSGTIINSGIIRGGSGTDGDTMANHGQGGTGVSFGAGELINSGTILGGSAGSPFDPFNPGGVGVYLHGGTLITSGTIEGGLGEYGFTTLGAAVAGNGLVVVEPGAVFDGSLAFTGILETVETTQTDLVGNNEGIAGSIPIFFADNAEFGPGKTIVLDGFAATSHSYVSGVGLELTDGGGSVTLDLTGSFSPGDFLVVTANGDTTITDANGPPVLTKPATVSIDAGISSAVSGISLSETGNTTGEIFTVTLRDNNGLLSATGNGITGSGSTALTITGSLALVNADLATLQDKDWIAAPDTITLSATDSLHGETGGSIAVTVNGSIGAGDLLIVPSGTAAAYLTVTNGGIVLIKSGGTASSDVLNNHGLQGILSGGTAVDTVIGSGGAQGVLGTARNTKINSGGLELVGPGGVSFDTTINSGGLEIVMAGGYATNSTIAAGGTELLAAGAQSAGSIHFSGSNASLLIGGETLPTTPISGFDLNGASGDQIVLNNFAYVVGRDTATLGAHNILTLNLNGTTEKLYLNPSENYVGHHFSITTNALDQVVIVDPFTGTSAQKMSFLASDATPAPGNPLTPVGADLSGVFRDLTVATGNPVNMSGAAAATVLDRGSAGLQLSTAGAISSGLVSQHANPLAALLKT